MVFILHAALLQESSQLFLWTEQDTPPTRKGRQPKLASHPFCGAGTWLRDWLKGIRPTLKPAPLAPIMWLPSTDKLPQSSPAFTATGTAPSLPDGPLHLKAWKVEGAALSVLDAVDFLLTRGERESNILGEDVHYWRKLTLYALSLVTAQRVIPYLEKENGVLKATWRPQTDQTEILNQWAEALPPLCRALTDTLETAPLPGALVRDWVTLVVDQTARQAKLPPRRTQTQDTTPGGKVIAALTGHNPIVALKGTDADQLLKDWHNWVGQSDIAGNAAFRITFRLDEPTDPDKPEWKLHYLLQAVDDPSLVVTAGQVWREKAKTAGYLHQRFDQPQERMLAALGFAARVFPPIEKSLRSPTPEKADLSTTDAYTFLRESAMLLQNSGFRVLLPRWWGGKTAKVSARAKVTSGKTVGKSLLTMDSLIRYEWEVVLGGQPISREEFERLARLKQPLVKLRGQWVVLDEQQIAAGLKLFTKADGQMRLDESLRLGLDVDPTTAEGVAMTGLETSGWFKTLLDTLRNPEKLKIPNISPTLKANLRPYQERGFAWLVFMRQYGLGACLADDMGLGKTLQSITLLLHERETLKTKAPALIICPTSVTGNWRRELNRFAPTLSVMVRHGTDRLSGAAFKKALKNQDVVITSYPLLVRDRELLESIEWSTLILDEAQNIKNPSTKQAQAARSIPCANRVALTGTPVENRLSELWSIFHFLNPGYLSSEQEFRKQFANPIERTGDKEAAKRLRSLTVPFVLRRLKTDPTIISDLPEKQEMKVYCTLTTEQGTLYQAVVNEAMEVIEDAEAEGNAMSRRGLVLSMLLKLKQVCNHPAQFLKDGTALTGRSGKLARLVEMLEEVYAAGDRALIFTQFAEMGELLRQHLREVFYDEPLWLHGGTPVKERESLIHRFQAVKGSTVFILSLKAGGVGLNLTRANHVFHFDRWWNPAVENQATDRAFRIGQTRNVQVHKYICAGTLEEKIDEMIESKKALAERVVGADESWLTELSTDSLRELVTLRQAEIG